MNIIPDTLINYFASLDEFRFELYSDLNEINLASKFPARYNNHLALAKSKLLASKSYGKPDSLLYVNKLATEYKGHKGYIYFFRYKQKKDDANWKFATVGLVPEDSMKFEFGKSISDIVIPGWHVNLEYGRGYDSNYDFTEYSEIKFREEEPVNDQLRLLLKRILYSKRKSARQFYDERGDRNYDEIPAPRERN